MNASQRVIKTFFIYKIEKKKFEVELITIKGTIFGKLYLNSVCLTFKTERRKTGKAYMFGSTSYQFLQKNVNKKWQLERIKEILLKRYHLIRQAVEIYFENSKSVLISFFDKGQASNFLRSMSKIVRGNSNIHMNIIEHPEITFLESKYREQWVSSQISNFEYLMLLNKYAGRSFNDLSQYPIFPWVIKDYENASISLSDANMYRDLNYAIAAISPEKRKIAESKIKILEQEHEGDDFQFGTHYLPSRVVLGYLLRLEPYSSLLIDFENGRDSADRMFHLVSDAWLNITQDPGDNKELIPEFYYFPAMFANPNKYYLGRKYSEKDNNRRDLVDQVILPLWARDNHHFVQLNYLALESQYVSRCLEKWIDLIFGYKQQEAKAYNLFKKMCDEDYVNKNLMRMSEINMLEIQEFGSHPIKMFKDRHPPKNESEFARHTNYTLFYNGPEERQYGIVNIGSLAHPIIYTRASKTRIIYLLDDLKIYRTKEADINMGLFKTLGFESKDFCLFPFIKFYDNVAQTFSCDPNGFAAILDEGNFIATSRHYDNSIKIINSCTGEIHQHLYFHRV